MTRRAWAVALGAAAVIFAAAGTILIAGSSEGPPDTTAVTAAATTAPGDAPTTPQPTTPQPTATTVEPNSTTRFEEAECRFSVTVEREVRCGYLVVPADRTDPASGELRSTWPSSRRTTPALSQTPSFYLEGGPGGDAPNGSFSFEDRFGPYLADRDVVMFDQRGRLPEPSLACPEARQLDFELLDDVLAPEEYVARQIEAVEACRDRLQGEGIDLSLFDSASSSADVADLGRALDYDRWNLYGISYGTRLALTVCATTQITSAASSSTRPTPGRCPHRVPRERRAVIRRVVRRLCG